VFDYKARQKRLAGILEENGIAALFIAPSADLEYLAGVERQIPNFGEASYAHGWAIGGFFRPDADPVFVFPRMFATFDLPEKPDGELVVINEKDDGEAMFAELARRIPSNGKVAIGDRVWAEATINLAKVVGFDRVQTGSRYVNGMRRVKDEDELAAMGRAVDTVEKAMAAVTPLCVAGISMGGLVEAVEHELKVAGSRCPSFTTHMMTGFGPTELDSGNERAWEPIPEGTSVMFDFGGVVDGYCSDFGRTIFIGEPDDEYRHTYEVMLAAQEAGRAACTPGTLARDVNAACRKPIEDAGYGEYFRHRMGHGIGKDVHEKPFVSEEDETPLEANMTFTDEPSIMIPGGHSVRIEDIVVCAEGGGRYLNSYPKDLVVNG
jgi:Xaa-Pro aminopeptidase